MRHNPTALSTIVPAVAEAVQPVPVVAAGGMATGRGLVAALTLGAQAASIGTRFVASEETCVYGRVDGFTTTPDEYLGCRAADDTDDDRFIFRQGCANRQEP